MFTHSLERLRAPGGAELYVPPGVWLTGPFNLTSRMTLFLARGAVIRATQVSASQPPSCSPRCLVRFRHCSSGSVFEVSFLFLRSRDAIEISMTLAISRRLHESDL